MDAPQHVLNQIQVVDPLLDKYFWINKMEGKNTSFHQKLNNYFPRIANFANSTVLKSPKCYLAVAFGLLCKLSS